MEELNNRPKCAAALYLVMSNIVKARAASTRSSWGPKFGARQLKAFAFLLTEFYRIPT
jgi:hypothetical protein